MTSGSGSPKAPARHSFHACGRWWLTVPEWWECAREPQGGTCQVDLPPSVSAVIVCRLSRPPIGVVVGTESDCPLLPSGGPVGWAVGPSCPLSDLCAFSVPACRGDRKKGITAAWKPKGADSTTRPSAGCWSPRSRVYAGLRCPGATSPQPRPLRLTLLPPHRSAPPRPCRRRPSPPTPCTPPSWLLTPRRRRRTAV